MPSSLKDPARLAALLETRLLDAPPEDAFDRISRMAAALLHAPSAFVSLVTDERQFFASQVGVGEPWGSQRGSGLDSSICQYVVESAAPVLITDLRTDEPRQGMRHLADEGVRSYAGVPLRTRGGYVLGSVCVYGPEPREWSAEDVAWLEQLSEAASDELELRLVTWRARDAAERAAEAAAMVQGSHELLTRLSALVPGVIYQFQLFPDGRTCFPFASEGIAEVYGVTPESVREDASAVYQALHPDDLERIAASIEQSAQQLTPWKEDYRTVVPSQGVRWRRGEARPERLPDGSTLWHGYITDITAEHAEARLREDLELQLSHARKMEAIGTLAGGIAHDFNNILMGIMGGIEAVRADLAPAHPSFAALDDAVSAARRARELTAQILSFSRRRAPTHVPLVLWPVIEEAWRLARASLPTTIEMDLSVDDPAAWVHADATQIHQVILNLCTNAAAALPAQRGRIVLRQRAVTIGEGSVATVEPLPPGEYVQLTVTDTGTGMDEDTRRRVFEPFFTTKEPGKGTGIGLTLVYSIVQGHHGGVTIDSESGVGTAFTIYLPRIAVPDAADVPVPHPTPVRPSAPVRELHVMVVDDEEFVGRAAERLLQRLGYRVSVFLHPKSALAWLRNGPDAVDIVVTDLTMPEMDGIELIAACRALRADLPLVLSSGLLDDRARARLQDVSGVTLLEKPYTRNELANALEQAIGTLPAGNGPMGRATER